MTMKTNSYDSFQFSATSWFVLLPFASHLLLPCWTYRGDHLSNAPLVIPMWLALSFESFIFRRMMQKASSLRPAACWMFKLKVFVSCICRDMRERSFELARFATLFCIYSFKLSQVEAHVSRKVNRLYRLIDHLMHRRKKFRNSHRLYDLTDVWEWHMVYFRIEVEMSIVGN